MQDFRHELERSVLIKAAPEVVFRYFTDSDRWAKWWGAGSTIDPRVGGSVYIRHPGGNETVGEVLAIDPPHQLTFSYGYPSGQPMSSEDSLVTIRLTRVDDGTRLDLRHEFVDLGARDLHIQGWRFQLSMFANVVANEVYSNAATLVDAWFAAWAISDESARRAAFAAIAESDVSFRDRYSLLVGIDDLNAHAGATLRYAPVRMGRVGAPVQCQGTVLADWCVEGRMRGTNVFVLNANGKIESAVGFAREEMKN